ncbi:MAG: hypothetical protein V2A77_10030, partial [Pseudomonadota bacterium]
MNSGEWFEQRKDFIFKEVVRSYVKNYLYCRTVYDKCKRDHELPFVSMDYWVGTETKRGPLWQIKDASHSLFRNVHADHGLRGYLFDWAVGSAFHAAMKLKEDVYLLGSYRLRQDALEGCGDAAILKRLAKCHQTAEKIGRGLTRQLKDIQHLLDEAGRQLRDLLPDQRQNNILMRYFLEERLELQKVWGPDALTRFFEEIFP